MSTERIVVIGASAGGIDAVRTIAAALPADFPAPICVVIHVSPESPGILPQIFDRAGPLPALAPSNGERIRSGRIYVAPPDHHLVIEPGVLRVTKGPKENRFRPAVDPLFRSAAQVYGPAAIGVILTGNLDDGASGLWTIRRLGGITIVQDPEDAQFPDMPQSALEYASADYTVGLTEIAPLLIALSSSAVEERVTMSAPDVLEVEVKIAKEHNAIDAGLEQIASPSPFACPECHGVLLELKDHDRSRFRCHTGHAYSPESLLAAVSERIEESLWTTMRTLEEGALLLRRMATHLDEAHSGDRNAVMTNRANELREQSHTIRRFVSEKPLKVPVA